MSERSASTFRRATATKAEQKMMVLLSSAKIPYEWQPDPIIRWDEDRTKEGKLKVYVPDFLIPCYQAYYEAEANIIVEVDGDAHNGEEEYDQKRDRYLESRGYRVLRFSNSQVLHHGKDVIATIQTELRRKPA